MKITGTPNSTANISASSPIPYRTGDVVVVQVVRIISISNATSDMQLKFPGGEVLNAAIQGKFAGKEGDILPLKIQSKTDKQVFAEIVRHQETHFAQKASISYYLSRLNLPSNQDSRSILQQMLRNGLPVTAENYEAIASASKKYKELTYEQIAFMVKHRLPFNTNTILMMNSLNEPHNLIGDQLLLLLYELMGTSGGNQELIDTLKAFFKKPKSEGPEDELKMSRTVKDLTEILDKLVKNRAFGDSTLEKLSDFIEKLTPSLEFMRYFNTDIAYLQIPLNINDFYATCELFVLKDGKKDQDSACEYSLFIRIPTQNLGCVEVFIVVGGDKSLQLHFRAETEDKAKYIKKNIIKLNELIKGMGYSISKVTYNELLAGINIQNIEFNAALITSQKKLDERV